MVMAMVMMIQPVMMMMVMTVNMKVLGFPLSGLSHYHLSDGKCHCNCLCICLCIYFCVCLSGTFDYCEKPKISISGRTALIERNTFEVVSVTVFMSLIQAGIGN